MNMDIDEDIFVLNYFNSLGFELSSNITGKTVYDNLNQNHDNIEIDNEDPPFCSYCGEYGCDFCELFDDYIYSPDNIPIDLNYDIGTIQNPIIL